MKSAFQSIFNLVSLSALLISLLGGAIVTQPAYAATITVNSTADNVTAGDSNCTLREAINNANSDSDTTGGDCAAGFGVDLISLPAGTYTLTLPPTFNENANADGDLDITDVDGLTISGTNVIIQQTEADRVFDLQANATATFQGITITGGSSTPGAGIMIRTDSNLTLDNVEVSGNNNSGRGGGIYNYYATLTIQNGSVIGRSGAPNTGCGGGGIFTEGTASTITTLDNSTVSYNQSLACAGGGFFVLSGAQLVIQNGSVVSNNIGGDPTPIPAPDHVGGGGIYGTASPIITITDSTISGNTVNCNGTVGCGGGGLKGGSSVTITNSTFSNNTVNCNASTSCGGGGVYNIGATITVTDSTFSGNTASRDGGGFYNTNALTITNSTLSNNSASTSGYGGGINNTSAASVTLTDSTLSNNSAWSGGGINNDGTATISHSTFSTNQTVLSDSTAHGGAIANSATGTLSATNSTISGNLSGGIGGVINLGTLTLVNATLSGNTANQGGGSNPGGLYNLGTLNYSNTIIANSTGVGECGNTGTIGTNNNNLVEDGSCSAALNGDPNLGSLANNIGPTQTHALLSISSPAVDAGASCPATDQRGITRPQGSACDIGAYEFSSDIPTVTTTFPPQNAVRDNLTTIELHFNQEMLDDGSADSAENTDNYLLVERGINGIFDTQSCNDGVASDDVQQIISSAWYVNNVGPVYTTILTLPGPLPNGNYRLFICGTTSIWSVSGVELNGGASDSTLNFTIAPAAASASALPDTGFAPNKITSLAPQSAPYAELGSVWLEIPSINVKNEIVGVPQSAEGWEVDWLGSSTGWLHGTAFPSWQGNSVLTAHVYDANGLPGPFHELKNLKHGDQVILHLFDEIYIFEVRESQMVLPDKTGYALQSLEGHSYLTLITCQGYNPLTDNYLFRRVVRAVLVRVETK